jgi:D-inositol-3-phosphate glycosyltransferase
MTSVEAQHSGCRVIASLSGGLPETDCGILDLVPAGNAYLVSEKIKEV